MYRSALFVTLLVALAGISMAQDWVSMGPTPILPDPAFSQGPWSGRINAIAPHPTNKNIVYVAAATGGVWRLKNLNKKEWVRITTSPEISESSHASGALVLDPKDNTNLYYGTGDPYSRSTFSHGAGLWLCLDPQTTEPLWSQIGTAAEVGSSITQIVVTHPDPPPPLPIAPQVVFVSSYDKGVVRGTFDSDDNDWTWVVTLPSPGPVTDLAYSLNAPNRIFAAKWASGIHRYDFTGNPYPYNDNWPLLTSGLPPGPNIWRINLSVCRDVPDVAYASFTYYYLPVGIYKTTDGGNTWTDLHAPPYTIWGHFNNCIAVHPKDPDICFVGGGNNNPDFIGTTDGGTTWSACQLGDKDVHGFQMCLAFGKTNPDEYTLWLGNCGGVYSTFVKPKQPKPEWPDVGSLSWENWNATLSVAQFYSISLHPTDPDCILGGTEYNGGVHTTDGGLTWNGLKGTWFCIGPVLIEPFPYTTDRWYSYAATPYFQSIARYDGPPFDGQGVGVTGPWNLTSWCDNPLVADPNLDHAGTILVGTNPVYRSANHGETWTALSKPNDNPWTIVRSMAVAKGNSDKIYLGLNLGDICHSEDGGASWSTQESPSGTNPLSGHISGVVIDPDDPKRAFACAEHSGYVWQTVDGGENWTRIAGDLGLHALSLAADFRHTPPSLYLGTCRGPYLGKCVGGSWTWSRFGNLDLPNIPVRDIVVDVAHDRLVAATFGLGVWKVDNLSSVALTGGVQSRGTPACLQARLSVTPNPSGAVTTVSYSLPRAGNASLKVYDMSGRLAATLSSGYHAAGPGASILRPTADGLARGVYLVRLTTNDATLTEKLIVQ